MGAARERSRHPRQPARGAPLGEVRALTGDGPEVPGGRTDHRLGQRRSQGIKDPVRGDESRGLAWEIDTEFIDNTAVIELPDHVRHHAVIAVLAPVVGDGMVTPSSAYHRGARSSVVCAAVTCHRWPTTR